MATNKVAFQFNPFRETGISVPKEKREEALSAVKDYVQEQVLSHVGAGKSPVAGGKWKKSLSKDYKAKKAGESSVGYANLELSGDLLDALEVVEVNSQKLSLQVEGPQAPKAEGNNLGSYGRSPDPSKAREFIPQPGQTFNRKITSGIRDILSRFSEEDEE